jgi:hypothetical protein
MFSKKVDPKLKAEVDKQDLVAIEILKQKVKSLFLEKSVQTYDSKDPLVTRNVDPDEGYPNPDRPEKRIHLGTSFTMFTDIFGYEITYLDSINSKKLNKIYFSRPLQCFRSKLNVRKKGEKWRCRHPDIRIVGPIAVGTYDPKKPWTLLHQPSYVKYRSLDTTDDILTKLKDVNGDIDHKLFKLTNVDGQNIKDEEINRINYDDETFKQKFDVFFNVIKKTLDKKPILSIGEVGVINEDTTKWEKVGPRDDPPRMSRITYNYIFKDELLANSNNIKFLNIPYVAQNSTNFGKRYIRKDKFKGSGMSLKSINSLIKYIQKI